MGMWRACTGRGQQDCRPGTFPAVGLAAALPGNVRPVIVSGTTPTAERRWREARR